MTSERMSMVACISLNSYSLGLPMQYYFLKAHHFKNKGVLKSRLMLQSAPWRRRWESFARRNLLWHSFQAVLLPWLLLYICLTLTPRNTSPVGLHACMHTWQRGYPCLRASITDHTPLMRQELDHRTGIRTGLERVTTYKRDCMEEASLSEQSTEMTYSVCAAAAGGSTSCKG